MIDDLGRLIEVGDGVHAYIQPDGTWWVNNSGLIAGRSSSVCVDTCATESRTRRYLQAVDTLGCAPVGTVVNTHHHSDHTFGNYLFSPAVVVAHERTRSELLRTGGPKPQPLWNDIDFGRIELAPPTITFRDTVSIWVDETECRVLHVGSAAHTTNDSIVWIESEGVLFCGDLLFNDITPLYVGGSISGAVHVLRDVLAPLGPRVIVAGHGEVADSSLIDRGLAYLLWIQDIAARGVAAGLTPLELARDVDLGLYADWPDAERIVGNLHRAYAEQAGAEPGQPLDIGAAMRDMVAYNGGRRLTTRA